MLALVLKLTLAPALVLAATLVSRRLGPRAAGLVSGLPVVAAPIALVLAVERGTAFAQAAAAAAVLGLAAQLVFSVSYALLARRAGVAATLVLAVGAYALAIALLDRVSPGPAVSALVSLAALAAAAATTRRLAPPLAGARGAGDLLLWRLVLTVALVLAFTAAARGLSAHLAGLLVPLPIITAIMAAFAHARAGGDAAIGLLHGLVRALTSFLVFFVVLAALLGHVPAAAAFGLATLATLGCWAATVAVVSGTPVAAVRARR